jgi:hypothetical protein
MKRITLLVFSLLMASVLFADGLKVDNSTKTTYNPDPNSGDVRSALNIYIAPSSYGGYVGSLTTFASYEIPMIDPNLTLGPEVGFAFGGNLNGVSSTTFVANVKATYYFDWMIPKMPDMFDVFVSSTTGLSVSNYSNSSSRLAVDFNSYVGGRWNFSDNMSVYVLAGYGSSMAAAGISFKF